VTARASGPPAAGARNGVGARAAGARRIAVRADFAPTLPALLRRFGIPPRVTVGALLLAALAEACGMRNAESIHNVSLPLSLIPSSPITSR
jgi:hypothetical protein